MFESEVALPEVQSGGLLVDPSSSPITIALENLSGALSNGRYLAPFMQVSGSECLYRFDGVGSFLVSHGSRILVDPEPGAVISDVRAYLFGSVIGTLLHQRGLLPLHISAVETPFGVIAFTGSSGMGKSTTAGEVHVATGWKILCDDIAVVRMIGGRAILFNGLVRLKLWRDALERLGMNEAQHDRDLVREDKFHVTAPMMFSSDGLELGDLITLSNEGSFGISRVLGVNRLTAVLNSVYRPYLSDIFGSRLEMTKLCGEVAACTNCYVFSGFRTHSDGPTGVVEVRRRIVEHVRSKVMTRF